MAKIPFTDILRRKRPLVMGIVNVTPDSFSDGGAFFNPENAIAHAFTLIDEGADILDIGGESTRPGADDVPIDEEIARVVPIIKALREKTDIVISIDTRKPEVAIEAIKAGADIWNDVTALAYAPNSVETAAKLNVPIILMHALGEPKNMQDNPHYFDVTSDVLSFLSKRIGACIAAGIKRENLIIDPGIGFGKNLEHNLELMANLKQFNNFGCPVLLGTSRKSFIAKIDENAKDPNDRLGGSLATALIGIDAGVSILRVHDVKVTVQALKVRNAIKRHQF